MVERNPGQIWGWRATYFGLGLGIIFFRILPFETGLPGLPGPDYILCIGLAWTLRQPAAAPLWMIVFLILLSDFLLQRPPGLWAMLAVIAVESLRSRRAGIAEAPFLFEWAMVSGAILLMVLAKRLILWILVVEQPTLGLSLMEGLATLAIYPIVLLASKYILRMDKLPPVDMETP